ncbi:MAG: MBL fold metallo-hydrolase [Theionarchaea archaeon]|nr:MBL fold metallo-hydrolase [Theionarchaea archaeon]
MPNADLKEKKGGNIPGIYFRFDFNKVGQGLFYSGDIGGVNFVYDCGCASNFIKNLGKKVIGPYKKRLRRKTIDLLVISHFHDDHTNGLQSLLRNITLNTVVLPYFTPIERLILALRADFPRWYYTFLRDPVFFFIERGAKKIIIISGDEGERGAPPIEIPSNPPEGDESTEWMKKVDIERKYFEEIDPRKLDIRKMDFKRLDIEGMRTGKDKELEDAILESDPGWKKFIGKELLVKNHDKWIKVSGVWMFRFFNCKLKKEKEKLDEFKTCLKKKKIDPSNPDSIKDAIIKDSLRKKIRECYDETLDESLNNTSLMVYHGPLGDNTSISYINCGKGLSFNDCLHFYSSKRREKCFHFDRNKMGQFLTGDINLNKDKKYNEIKTHYTNFFGTVMLSQIPHHGSKKNWRSDILHDLGTCNRWVASSGCPNSYGHPHREVILDILENERCFCWSNQHCRFFMEGIVAWK